ncbi:MAG: hypothetical protein K2M17_00095 [Bacilli bacterium]|nr:hypothetical protein [Bacilli bacterium]
MLKNKYQRLSKEEKKKAREDFFTTDLGKSLKFRFNRLLVVSVLLMLYSAYIIIDTFLNNGSLFGYSAGILVFIFALVFLIGRHKLIIEKTNNYLIIKK